MRLEYRNQLARTHYRAGRAQCSGNLGWVVSVIVIDPDTAALSVQFEATLGSGEVRNSLGRGLKIKSKSNQNRNRTSGI